MAIDIFYQGESFNRTITITDSDGNAIDLDTLNEITVEVFRAGTYNTIITKTLTGGGVEKTDASNGECICYFDKSETESLKPGIYKVEITTQETNTNYENDTLYGVGQSDFFELKTQSK
jgi:hypothetical protein